MHIPYTCIFMHLILKLWILISIMFNLCIFKHDMKIKQPRLALNTMTMQIGAYPYFKIYVPYIKYHVLSWKEPLNPHQGHETNLFRSYLWHTPQIDAIAWFKVRLARVQIRSSGGHRIDDEITICDIKICVARF